MHSCQRPSPAQIVNCRFLRHRARLDWQRRTQFSSKLADSADIYNGIRFPRPNIRQRAVIRNPRRKNGRLRRDARFARAFINHFGIHENTRT